MVDSRPARSCCAANGTTVRSAPWKPPPKPAPAIAVPRKNTTVESTAMATSVTATPAIRASVPRDITSPGRTERDSSTATPPLPASTNSARPPSTSDDDPTTIRTSAGPTEA